MAIKIKNFKLRLPDGDIDLVLPSEGGGSIDEEVIEQIQQDIKDAIIYNESLTLTEDEKEIARNNINAASYDEIFFPNKEKFEIEEDNIIHPSNEDAEIDLSFLLVDDTIYSEFEILSKGAIITTIKHSSDENKIYNINGYIKNISQEEEIELDLEHDDNVHLYMVFNKANNGDNLGFIVVAEVPNSSLNIFGQEYILTNSGVYATILKNDEEEILISGFYNVENKLVTAAEAKELAGSGTDSAHNKIYIGAEEPSTDEYDIWIDIPEDGDLNANVEDKTLYINGDINNKTLFINGGTVENKTLFI